MILVDLETARLCRQLQNIILHAVFSTTSAVPSVICFARQVMIAVQDDAAGNLTNSAKRALLSVGAGRDEVAALGLHKHASFAMIGRKGATPGSVPQVFVCVTSLGGMVKVDPY